jgi:hypothetical protein
MKMSLKQSQLGNYIELADFMPVGKMLREEVVQINDAEAIAAWREKFHDIDVFSSICRHTKPEEQSQYIASVFFDIDSLAGIQRIVTWTAEHPSFAGCDNNVVTKYCNKEICFYRRLKPERNNKGNHSTVISEICGHQTGRPRVTKPFSSEVD